MWAIQAAMPLSSLSDTTLWKRLSTGFEGQGADLAQQLATALEPICLEAQIRMKAFPSLHPEYTLHDDTHLLRVTELMGRVMSAGDQQPAEAGGGDGPAPRGVLETLNPVELAVLVLSAHFHDQGMVLEAEELQALDSDPGFQLFQGNWAREHPNLREVEDRLRDRHLSDSERLHCERVQRELLGSLLSDYIRRTHAERSGRFVREHYGHDRRWVAAGTSLAELVARLCESHHRPAADLTPVNGFNYDESVGPYQVNMPFLGVVLRLADILDFDRDRTPGVLYRTIHFTSTVSLAEWAKHRSVEGWVISPREIWFTMRCEHPVYERAARHFMDRIDDELASAQAVLRTFPQKAARYRLDLPLRVDRSRIGPKDESYIYHDLEFSLSRDEIVHLFMGDEFYESPSLCIRELLQNSLDALRYRKALIKRDLGTDWLHGEIIMEHTPAAGVEVVRCTDNGAGMDEAIITRFLTKVGRSYYRSPEFEQERASFASVGADFEPCSQFGIGFMSCFMLGDHITIHTRRDYGPRRGQGEPLVVEVNGLGGLVVIRQGRQDQPVGTTVEIAVRVKSSFAHKWEDPVELLEVVKEYCLACEFPIKARRAIPGRNAEETTVPAVLTRMPTALERAGVKTCITLEQDFSEIAPESRGHIRESFLIDTEGRLTTGNREAHYHWRKSGMPTLETETEHRRIDHECAVCLDGIKVYSVVGWGGIITAEHPSELTVPSNPLLLDVRGKAKPPLLPSRKPQEGAGWRRLEKVLWLAHGRLWEQVAARLGSGLDNSTFWRLVTLYSADISWVRAGIIWSFLAVPVRNRSGKDQWRRLPTLDKVHAEQGKDAYSLVLGDGSRVGGHESRRNLVCVDLVCRMSTMILMGDEPVLEVREPVLPDRPPAELGQWLQAIVLPYGGLLEGAVSAQMPFESANSNHSLVHVACEGYHRDPPSTVDRFARAAVSCLSNARVLDALCNPGKPIRRDMRNAGRWYLTVDWPGCDARLAPPYRVWTAEAGMVEVTARDLERWAVAEVSDEPDLPFEGLGFSFR